MTKLYEQLTALRVAKEETRDPVLTAHLNRATDELQASGILAGVRSVGEQAPMFARPNLDGDTVRLRTLLRRGPVIVSFFRGRW